MFLQFCPQSPTVLSHRPKQTHTWKLAHTRLSWGVSATLLTQFTSVGQMLGSSCGEAPSHLGAEGNALHGEYIKDLMGQGVSVSVCISVHGSNISSSGIRVKGKSTEANGYGVIQEELGCPLERKHIQQSFGQNLRLFDFSRVGVYSCNPARQLGLEISRLNFLRSILKSYNPNPFSAGQSMTEPISILLDKRGGSYGQNNSNNNNDRKQLQASAVAV